MYALRNFRRNTPKVFSAGFQQCREHRLIIGRPRKRVPLPEKIALGIFLTTVPLLYPFYIATHFCEWQERKKG